MKKIYVLLIALTSLMACKPQVEKKTETKEPVKITEELAADLQLNKECLVLQSLLCKATLNSYSLLAMPMDVAHPSYMDQFYILEQSDGKARVISLPEGAGGYADGSELKLFSTGHNPPVLLLTTPMGGSGGYSDFYLIDANKKDDAVIASSEQLIEKMKIKGKFLDGYKCQFELENVGEYQITDTKIKESLQESGVYNKSGKVIKHDVAPWVGGFWSIKAAAKDKEIILDLNQPLIGTYHAEKIGLFQSKWKYSNGKLELLQAGVSSL